MDKKQIDVNIDQEYIANIFGDYDKNMKIVAETFNVEIVQREDKIKIIGAGENIDKAERTLKVLLKMVKKGERINNQNLEYIIDLVEKNREDDYESINSDLVCVTENGKAIKPKTINQKKYVDSIRDNTVVFGIGPAGTGKTFLAMAMAITAFKKKEVKRIILTRPAIEAGEKLGFLPGDLQEKVDPYLRPLYDALYEIMGAESFEKNLENGLIEVAPLAYMRGRTLDNAFIVLDEAQNTTPQQMKMFLTRIGFHSKAVVTGDVTQIDLLENEKSGLVEASNILKNIAGIGIEHLDQKDVVRHPLVQKIINAYDIYENRDDK